MSKSPTNKAGTHTPDDTQREQQENEEREHNLDKTIEDSFPASDPPSTIPDPDHEEGEAA